MIIMWLLSQKTGGDGDGTVATLPPEGWVAIPGAVIVREKHEKKSNTRDEIDERLETEEVHHLGHLTNQVLCSATTHLSHLLPHLPPFSFVELYVNVTRQVEKAA